MPLNIDQTFKAAVDFYQTGRWVQASQACRQILDEQPQQAAALHLMGLLAQRAGNAPLSISMFEQATASFSKTAKAQPRSADTWLGLAASLRELGHLHDAVAAYRQALCIKPNLPRTLVELGHVQLRLGQLDPAIISYQKAVQLSPTDVDAQNSLGSALISSERFPEAEQIFRSALQIAPASAPVWNNLGNLYRVQARMDEALDAYQKAVLLPPPLAAAHSNLGNALRDQGKLPEAIAELRHSIVLDPGSPTLMSNLVFAGCFDPGHNAQQLLDDARLWSDRFETPLMAEHRSHDNDRDPDRRLRIGYVSPDFRAHVIGRNVLPILENHDHSNFEIHCFSTLTKHDAQTASFINAADRWHECGALDDARLAEKVREERIDILIDLSLHLAGNRLLAFARKPAPVQVTWAGYPGTTGLRSIDCRITDPHLDPPGETDALYSEKSERLPHSFWCYRPMPGTPQVNPLPAHSSQRITFGCLNNPTKLTAVSHALWAEVLREVPKSRLLLIVPTGSMREAISDQFKAAGIDPARLIFVAPCPADQHFARYHLVDISLDPLPYTGHTSTLDSLWMGVPVVTLPGQTSVSRGSVTPLRNLQLTNLIAADARDYVRIAAGLAADVPSLLNLRRSLRDRMRSSPLCAEAIFTKDMESTYRKIWRAIYAVPGE